MIGTLEGYMDQFYDHSQQSSSFSPSSHIYSLNNKAIQRIKYLSYILHAWVPEVSVCVCASFTLEREFVLIFVFAL